MAAWTADPLFDASPAHVVAAPSEEPAYSTVVGPTARQADATEISRRAGADHGKSWAAALAPRRAQP